MLGPMSCGGVFRMHWGFISGFFASPLPILHAFEIELVRLRKVLELAQREHWSPLLIKTDSV